MLKILFTFVLLPYTLEAGIINCNVDQPPIPVISGEDMTIIANATGNGGLYDGNF